MNDAFKRVITAVILCGWGSLNAFPQHVLAVEVPDHVVAGTVATVQTKQAWEKFSPAAGGFSVLMPGKPTVNDQEVETANGKLINHMFMVMARPSVYMVSYAEFPTAVTDPAQIKTMLDSARDKALSASSGELRNEKEIKLGENFGREWSVYLPGRGIARARAYWVTRRLYQTIVLTPDDKNPEAEKSRELAMSKFLDSFALLDAGGSK